MSKKILRIIAVCIITSTTLLSWTSGRIAAQGTRATPPIRLGVLLTLTGAGSYYGKYQLDAIHMAVNSVNKAGGIKGHKIQLVIQDTRTSNTGAISALNKILEANPVAIVGPVYGTEMLALEPLLDRAGVPTITISATRAVTQQGSKYVFRTDVHDGVLKVALTDYILNHLRLKKVGLLVTNDAWGTSGRLVVTEVLADHHLSPVDVETYDPSATQMTAQLEKLKSAGAQIIVTQGYTPDQAIILREAHDLGLGIPIFVSTDGLQSCVLDITTAADCNGVYAAGLLLPSISKNPKIRKWASSFQKLYHYVPNLYVTIQYDGVSALLAVMKKYGITRDAIRDGMHRIKYHGMNGIFHADAQGNMLSTCHIYRFNSRKVPRLLMTVTVPKSQQK